MIVCIKLNHILIPCASYNYLLCFLNNINIITVCTFVRYKLISFINFAFCYLVADLRSYYLLLSAYCYYIRILSISLLCFYLSSLNVVPFTKLFLRDSTLLMLLGLSFGDSCFFRYS